MSCKIVAKFGGSSVKTAENIKKVANIIEKNPSIKVVVVSAVGGITDLLVEFTKSDFQKQKQIAQEILKIHLDIIQELSLPLQEKIEDEINRLFKTNVFNAQSLDHIVSLGEDLSSIIIANYFNFKNIKTLHVDSRSLIVTDDNYGNATPQIDLIREKSFPNTLFVTQGFVGADENKNTTVLGRGGSDYSAALIAEAINADEVLIYTDVAGVYTSDPRYIQNTKPIDEISFQEIAEMANFGAKVLHPTTLEPCIRKNINIRILSTFEPEKKGTLIQTSKINPITNHASIRAITVRSNQFLVTIKSLKMINAYGFLANIFTILSDNKISIDLITTSEASVSLTIDNNMTSCVSNPFKENNELLQKLKQFAEISIEDDLTLISVVGNGLTIPGTIQKILKVIESYKIRLICYGASNSSIGILVQKDKAYEMANLLHQHLLGENNV